MAAFGGSSLDHGGNQLQQSLDLGDMTVAPPFGATANLQYGKPAMEFVITTVHNWQDQGERETPASREPG
jgi:hypothetical protein